MKEFPLSNRTLVTLAVVLASGIALSLSRPLHLAYLAFLSLMILAKCSGIGSAQFPFPARFRRAYRPRNTGAGRWLEAPVAELDKTTIGKLLASRARRDPGLHVVVRNSPPPVRSDALYDPELDD